MKSAPSRSMWLLLGLELLISSAGCARSSTPLDMAALDRSQDHWRIAALYSQEAIAFHQRAEELSKEAVMITQRAMSPDKTIGVAWRRRNCPMSMALITPAPAPPGSRPTLAAAPAG